MIPETLHPFSSSAAEQVYIEDIAKLLRAAYLQPFSQTKIDSCRYRFPSFLEWWATLNDIQKVRVKGVLAALIL